MSNYGSNVDPLGFDAASALVFWLGGLPQYGMPVNGLPAGTTWTPAGFNANAATPFMPGTSRTEPFFQFIADRLGSPNGGTSGPPSAANDNTGLLRYYPQNRVTGSPYVYFRAYFDTTTIWPNNVSYAGLVMDFTSNNYNPAITVRRTTAGIAVPYVQLNPLGSAANPYEWRDDDQRQFQIIAAGRDENFGAASSGETADLTDPPSLPRVSRTGQNFPTDGGDFDNLTSFSSGTLEAEINQ